MIDEKLEILRHKKQMKIKNIEKKYNVEFTQSEIKNIIKDG